MNFFSIIAYASTVVFSGDVVFAATESLPVQAENSARALRGSDYHRTYAESSTTTNWTNPPNTIWPQTPQRAKNTNFVASWNSSLTTRVGLPDHFTDQSGHYFVTSSITQNFSITPQTPTTHSSMNTTVTVAGGETVIAFPGWKIVGIGEIVGSSAGFVVVYLHVFTVLVGESALVIEDSGGEPSLNTDNRARQTAQSSSVDMSKSISSSSWTSLSSSSSNSVSSSTATPTPYIIFPKGNIQETELANFSLVLGQTLPGSSSNLTGLDGKFMLWRATLTPSQAFLFGENPIIESIKPEIKLLLDLGYQENQAPSSRALREKFRTRYLNSTLSHRDVHTIQEDAPDDLVLLSQPPGLPFNGLPGYVYSPLGGRHITVYVIDSGIESNSQEWINIHGMKSIIYAPGADPDKEDFNRHGTHMACKIAGPVFGVAKESNIVAVKMAFEIADNADGELDALMSTADLISALLTAGMHILNYGLQGAVVVNISLGFYEPDYSLRVLLETILEYFVVDLRAVVVTAAGNNFNGNRPHVDEYPALFLSENGGSVILRDNMIVVGGITEDGFQEELAQGRGDEVTVSAPFEMECEIDDWQTGTSVGTAMVSGLAAYFMSMAPQSDHSPADVKRLIRNLAYPRASNPPGLPIVVWNGADFRNGIDPVTV